MEINLKRNNDDGIQTLGELEVKGLTFKTLERPWKGNAKSISCIPKGLYDVKWSFSPKFLRFTYEVLKVPNRTGVRIHKGNYFFDIEGCILLGTGYGNLNKDKEVDLINSTIAIKKFEDLMERKPFQLLIQ